MHAVLAACATSTRRLSPGGEYYTPMENYHWQQAIRLYKGELTTPIGAHNMDALMSTCMLISFISFSAEEYKPTDSWLFSSDPTALSWLTAQSGLRCILGFTAPYLEQSIWYRVFMEADEGSQTFDEGRPGRD